MEIRIQVIVDNDEKPVGISRSGNARRSPPRSSDFSSTRQRHFSGPLSTPWLAHKWIPTSRNRRPAPTAVANTGSSGPHSCPMA
jgi:hypothetical protein